MAFQGLHSGDRIRFWIYNGLMGGLGRSRACYTKRIAKVQHLLVFEDHVVVNLGGRHGTPYVVNADNYIGRA